MADELNKELNALIGELRAKADEKDKEIKKLGDASGETKQELERMKSEFVTLSKQLDELEAKAKAPGLSMETKAEQLTKAKSDLADILRKGNYQITGNTSGGYTVPAILSEDLILKMRPYDPMRSLSTVVSISGGSPYYIPRVTTAQTGGWRTETTAASASTPGVFEQRSITPHSVYTQVTVTRALVEDSKYDIVAHIMNESAEAIAYMEGKEFVSGDGNGVPTGVMSDATVLANYETAGDDALTADALVKVPLKLPTRYLMGGNLAYLVNRKTMAAVLTLKTASTSGDFYFHAEPNQAYKWTLNGYPVYLSDSMPDIGNATCPVLFGNFSKGYRIIDVADSMFIVRNEITSPGFITFHVEKRTGGRVANPDCFAVVKTS